MNRQGILLCLLLLVSISFANTLNIRGSVDSSGVTSFTIKSEFSGFRGQNITLNISAPLNTVIVTDRSGFQLAPTIQYQGNNTLISVKVPVDYLQFDIITDSLTAKSDALWNFNLVLGTSYNVSSISASFAFPSGAVIRSSNGAIGGTADSLSVFWQGSNLDPEHRMNLRTSYELTNSQFDPLLLAAGAVILVIIVIFFYFFIKSRKAAPGPSFDALASNEVFRTLDEVDREIVREIYSQKGKTTQAYLYLNTHIPKATLSRRIASLSSRGIIVKSQKGNRNLVTLGDVFKK